MELTPVKFPSTNVLAIGFNGDRRGNVHVQFCDSEKNPTQRGFYSDVQRALFLALENDHAPGRFIHTNLKDKFEWVPLEVDAHPDLVAAIENPDLTLPAVIHIPADVANTIEAIDACINAQRIQPERKGLFE